MHYKSVSDRVQSAMFTSLEELVSAHSVVRLIDGLLNQLYKQSPADFQTNKGQKHRGSKAYSPLILSKLFLYGYLNRIASSRRLEQETYRNIELMWLLSEAKPDHKTIADFRKDNGQLIRHITVSFRRFLQDNDFIDGKVIATDGTKLKAYTKREVITLRHVVARLSKIEEDISHYLTQLSRNDSIETTEEEVAAKALERTTLEQEITKLKAEIFTLDTYKKTMLLKGTSSYSKHDPEAVQMKTRDGFLPAYNVQTTVDAKHKMIVAAEAITDANDIKTLTDNIVKVSEQLGIVPEIVLADKGYGNTAAMQKVEDMGATCFIPLSDNPHTKRDAENGVSFTHDAQSNSLTCSQGKTLKYTNTEIKNGQQFEIYQAKKEDCKACILFGKCTHAQQGRRVHIGERLAYKKACLWRQNTEAFKAQFEKRKGIVEHPFGTLKLWMGKIPLLLTTRKKVQIEIDLYTSAYNLRRLTNLRPMSELLALVAP